VGLSLVPSSSLQSQLISLDMKTEMDGRVFAGYYFASNNEKFALIHTIDSYCHVQRNIGPKEKTETLNCAVCLVTRECVEKKKHNVMRQLLLNVFDEIMTLNKRVDMACIFFISYIYPRCCV
jgi:hypothetical protein